VWSVNVEAKAKAQQRIGYIRWARARTPRTAARRRVKLPLVECAHEARPGEEMSPERVADILLEEEARWLVML
jgi:hypothetical protein